MPVNNDYDGPQIEYRFDFNGNRRSYPNSMTSDSEQPTVLEAAAKDIVDEINRCIKLGEVPQLRQIRWWGGHLAVALEADQLIRAKSEEEPRHGG